MQLDVIRTKDGVNSEINALNQLDPYTLEDIEYHNRLREELYDWIKWGMQTVNEKE
jgi:hypothetical protein